MSDRDRDPDELGVIDWPRGSCFAPAQPLDVDCLELRI